MVVDKGKVPNLSLIWGLISKMRYRLSRFKSLFYKLLFLAFLLIGLFVFLLATTPGLNLATTLATLILPGKLEVKGLHGRLLDQFSFGALNYNNKDIELKLINFTIQWQLNKLFYKQLPIKIIQASELDMFIKKTDKIAKKYQFSLPKLPFKISIEQAAIDKIKLSALGATAELNRLKFKAYLDNKLWQIPQLSFIFANTAFSLQAKSQPFSPYALVAKLETSKNRKNFAEIWGNLSLYHWHVEVNNPASFALDGTLSTGVFPRDLTIQSRLSAAYFGNLIQGSAQYQNQQFNATLNLGKNQLELKGSPTNSWQLQATFPELKLLHPSLATLKTIIEVQASLSHLNEGKATLIIQPGSYHLSNKGALTALQFNGGQFDALLNPEKLAIKGKLIIDSEKSLLLHFTLPQFQLNQGWKNTQKIQGNLSLKVNSLRFFEQFSPHISKIEGQLNASLNVKGTFKKPFLEGQLSLDQARLLINKLGIDLHPIQISLQSRDKQWSLQGKLLSQGQSLELNGKGYFTPQIKGIINIDANHFPLIKTDEYLINLSPKLLLSFSQNSIDLTGNIVVPNAQIKPQTFKNTVSLTSDAVFINKVPEATANPFPIKTDIRLEMGENVMLTMKGLQGFLDGTIHLRQLPQNPLNATGELTIRQGKYQAYGEELAIDQGELIFTGGLIDNPGINVRATRRFNPNSAASIAASQLLDFNSANKQNLNFGENTIVGIQVSGQLKSPKVELFSEPTSLSQADILSLLILGKPASQADSAGGQLLLKAITSMNLGSGTKGVQLLEQLKQTLDLDVNLKTDTVYNQQTKQVSNTKAVVVGKSLSKRIYLSYNFGLAQTDSNVLTLTYLLNKFFSIQVNASTTTSGIDLLYTHST